MTKTKRSVGRPKVEIDKKQFEALCKIMCTRVEIAQVLGCSDVTLQTWCKREYNKPFSEIYDTFRAHGKASLRRSQFNLAQKNSSMAIWLGKQYLDQKDEQTLHQNITPVVIVDDL